PSKLRECNMKRGLELPQISQGLYWTRLTIQLSLAECLVPASIHAVVVREVRGVFDFTHPILMRAVPIDRCRKPRNKIKFRGPVPFATDFRTINRVTPVVARPILHKLNERLRLVHQSQNLADDFQIRLLVPTTDVVYLSGPSALERKQDGSGMLIGKDPFAHIQTVAVDRKRPIIHRVRDKNRN